eukprot:gene12585-15809_t
MGEDQRGEATVEPMGEDGASVGVSAMTPENSTKENDSMNNASVRASEKDGVVVGANAKPYTKGHRRVTPASATVSAQARRMPKRMELFRMQTNLGLCLWVSRGKANSVPPSSSDASRRFSMTYAPETTMLIMVPSGGDQGISSESSTSTCGALICKLTAASCPVPHVMKVPAGGVQVEAADGNGLQPREADWKLWSCHVPEEHLPPDCLIRGVGVACVVQSEKKVKRVDALLGHVSLSEGVTSLSPSGNNNITISHVIREKDLLSCDLSWLPEFDALGLPLHGAYHVWACLMPGALEIDESMIKLDSMSLHGVKPYWLGQTTVARWYMETFTLPATKTPTSIIFIVQTVSALDGLVHASLEKCKVRGMMCV